MNWVLFLRIYIYLIKRLIGLLRFSDSVAFRIFPILSVIQAIGAPSVCCENESLTQFVPLMSLERACEKPLSAQVLAWAALGLLTCILNRSWKVITSGLVLKWFSGNFIARGQIALHCLRSETALYSFAVIAASNACLQCMKVATYCICHMRSHNLPEFQTQGSSMIVMCILSFWGWSDIWIGVGSVTRFRHMSNYTALQLLCFSKF